MSHQPGKYSSVSQFRRLIVDLLHFMHQVPSATLDRQMNLAKLVSARRMCSIRPTWSALLTKAFAIVSARTPLLRTAYLKFPWPRFYEHPFSIATINIDRQLANERIIIYAHIKRAENRSLREIDDIIRFHQQEPIENLPSYNRAVSMTRVPWPFRRWAWWLTLNMLGYVRAFNFGTFGITSVGAHGAGILHVVPLITSQLHYGIIDPTGGLTMRLSFDHRVLDGAVVAGILADLENVLVTDMVRECTEVDADHHVLRMPRAA